MSRHSVLVTGATGKTGRRVVAILRQKGVDLRAVSRTSPVPFDWDDDATWPAAVEGVDVAYLVHPGLGSPEAAGRVGAFARVAALAGARRAVLLSTPDDGSAFSGSMRDAEQQVIDAGLGLTSLRLRWFFQNLTEDFLLPSVLSGEMRLPAGDGREAFVDADDIAEVAVAALLDPRHSGRSYEVSGPRLLGFADIATEITLGAGHALRYVPLDPDVFVAELLAAGVSEDWAHVQGGMYQDIAAGRLETVSGDVEKVLGKPARDFSAFASQPGNRRIWTKS